MKADDPASTLGRDGAPSADFSLLHSHRDYAAASSFYMPPEAVKSGWDAVKQQPLAAVDAYMFGVFIYEAFNGHPTGADALGNRGSIPQSMYQSYKRLLNPNPKARLSVGHFFEQGLRQGGFFKTRLIELTEGIENLGLQSESERIEFLGYVCVCVCGRLCFRILAPRMYSVYVYKLSLRDMGLTFWCGGRRPRIVRLMKSRMICRTIFCGRRSCRSSSRRWSTAAVDRACLAW